MQADCHLRLALLRLSMQVWLAATAQSASPVVQSSFLLVEVKAARQYSPLALRAVLHSKSSFEYGAIL